MSKHDHYFDAHPYNHTPHLQYKEPQRTPIFKASLRTIVTVARHHIAQDSYSTRNAKEIDRTKDQPARLPKGWSKNILNGNY